MKKWIMSVAMICLSALALAANVSTAKEVDFFQTPSKGALFDYADVYMMQDVANAQATGRYGKSRPPAGTV